MLRAATTADKLRLDLAEQLAVSEVSVDGAPAAFQHTGKDLVIKTPVTRDQRLVIEVEYAGTPEPVEAPASRSDFSKIGWQTNDDGTTWTMQEPFGAFTWFAVNDQPSDKALYDFTLISDNHLVGVANGELVDASVRGTRPRTGGTWPIRRRRTSPLWPSTTSAPMGVRPGADHLVDPKRLKYTM